MLQDRTQRRNIPVFALPIQSLVSTSRHLKPDDAAAFSKWLDSSSADRRDATVARRQADLDAIAAQREADREAKHDLEMCEITCERLRERPSELLSERSYLRGLLAAHNVPIPTDRRIQE